jgi:predicted transcriptional regulator
MKSSILMTPTNGHKFIEDIKSFVNNTHKSMHIFVLFDISDQSVRVVVKPYGRVSCSLEVDLEVGIVQRHTGFPNLVKGVANLFRTRNLDWTCCQVAILDSVLPVITNACYSSTVLTEQGLIDFARIYCDIEQEQWYGELFNHWTGENRTLWSACESPNRYGLPTHRDAAPKSSVAEKSAEMGRQAIGAIIDTLKSGNNCTQLVDGTI